MLSKNNNHTIMRIKKEILFGGKIFDTEFDFKRPKMESVRQGAVDV